MIKTEFYLTRQDGVTLVRTYSDEGKYIRCGENVYEEAIDPEGSGRIYEETDELIPVPELTPEEALEIITGGEV